MKITAANVILATYVAIVALIIVCAFSLSYYNLRETAIAAGTAANLAPTWPICIDAFLLAGSIFVLRAGIFGEDQKQGWAVLIAFTAVSVGFNAIHSPRDPVSICAHMVPPVALCVSLEMLMVIIKSDLTAKRLVLEPKATMPTYEVCNCATPDIPIGTATKKVTKRGRRVTEDVIISIFRDNPGISVNKAKDLAGVAWDTANAVKQKIDAEKGECKHE